MSLPISSNGVYYERIRVDGKEIKRSSEPTVSLP
jgi:hypothetical protein